jgi:hypothetical protein
MYCRRESRRRNNAADDENREARNQLENTTKLLAAVGLCKVQFRILLAAS